MTPQALTPQGFLNLYKLAGWTSHDCVAKVRRILSQKRVGHGGTLDPAAVGVLPIAVGRATRLINYLSSDKAYRATIRFGVTTTTDDLEGEVIAEAPVPHLTLDDVTAILPRFEGQIDQIPPQYSAISVDGKRAYDLARAGQVVDIPIRTVTVYRIEVLAWRSLPYPELEVAIACSAGTYIRSIARDLGDQLQTGAALAHLIRTRSSGFVLEESITLDDLLAGWTAGENLFIPPEQALQHLPLLTLDGETARRWQQGQKVAIAPPTTSLHYRVHGEDQTFLGVGEWIDPTADQPPRLRPRVVYDP
ncbi:MAG TPA: tRNA pseudouridine(55) synthase TruB [Candidatus Obscuribacterales bacterium]